MNKYRTSQVADLFGVSTATVRNWAAEFVEYLSPTAKPSDGRRFAFTEDDLGVFSLVHQGVRRGLDYADVHAELKNGQRGEIPEYSGPPSDLVLREAPRQLVLMRNEIERLNAEIEVLRTARDKAEGKIELLEKLLEQQLGQKETAIRGLYEELARLKAQREGQ